MSNLLRAGLARYLKHPLTALVAVASLVIGVLSGCNAVYIKFLPLYSLGLTAIFGATGYTVFRRRDLK